MTDTNKEEINEMMQDTWTIARTDCDGVTTTRTFQTETWPFALQQFVSFLKQDFGVDDSSVAINGSKHTLAGENPLESGWYGEVFYPKSTEELDKEEFYSPESYPAIGDEDGWITWDGGECPVDDNTLVKVKFSNGDVYCTADNASGFYWDHNHDVHIVAYKVIE